MKQVINLVNGIWSYDDDCVLGAPGGFGVVFSGESQDGRPVAVKRLKSNAAGPINREIELAEYFLGHKHPHVIGIFDVGVNEDSGDVFIVMERAQQSLQELIESDAPLAPAAALEILDAIAAGLEEIGEIVHRDLKPPNVLLHQGVWKIADLGLARFLEASTAQFTMRDYLTYQYCAPEQLDSVRPTKATDVYALGGVAYALLTGKPPFSGPLPVDYAQQHRFEVPRKLDCVPALAQLAIDCLSKSPNNRPSLTSLRNRIQKARAGLGV